MSPEREGKFVDTADEYEIASYMDVSLYNAVYKGGKKDSNGNYESWDSEVNNLADDARITLELNEDMNGKDVVLVHEKHDGTYEIIETNYDSNNNTITFETNSFSTYAIATKEAEPKEQGDEDEKEYTVTDSKGNSITFSEVPGRSFELTIMDFFDFTKEEIMEMTGVSSSEYDETVAAMKEIAKKDGTLVSILEITVNDKEDGHDITEGPFQIKIKLTDEMKKYNSFKLVYLKDDMIVGETIELKVKDGYLVGTLKHLSTYLLIGNNVDNPATGDNIMLYVIMLILSTIGLTTSLYIKKRLN
jgi:hypothetical protein